MTACTFRMEDWGALNADVTQALDIRPVTVGSSTDYQPTLRFTISNRFRLMGVAADTSTYYFEHGAPVVGIVE